MTWNRAVAHEQHHLAIRCGQARAQRGADGVADRAVEGLADELGPFRHQGLGRAEEGHAGLGDDHGAGLQEVADPIEEAADRQRPVRLGLEPDRPPVRAALGGPLDIQRRRVPVPEPARQPEDEFAERDVRVDVPLDLDRSIIGADGPILGQFDGEPAGVEVGRQGPELEHAIRLLDPLAHVVAAAIALVKADELGMALIEHRLAQHHGGVRQACPREEVGELVLQPVADQLHVPDDHRLDGGIQHGRGFLERFLKRLRVAGRLARRLEGARRRAPHPHDVGRQRQIDGLLVYQACREHAVDLRRRGFRGFEERRGRCDARVDVQRDPVIAEGVVQQGAVLM